MSSYDGLEYGLVLTTEDGVLGDEPDRAGA
jgi:hypothetical protein